MRGKRAVRASAAVVGALLVTALGLSSHAVDTTEAAWGDSERGSATFGAATLSPPTPTGCTSALTSFTATWGAPSPPSPLPTGYSYRIDRIRGTGVVQLVDWTPPSSATSFSFQPTGTLTLGDRYTFSVRSSTATWTSNAIVTGEVAVVLGAVGLNVLGACRFPR